MIWRENNHMLGLLAVLAEAAFDEETVPAEHQDDAVALILHLDERLLPVQLAGGALRKSAVPLLVYLDELKTMPGDRLSAVVDWSLTRLGPPMRDVFLGLVRFPSGATGEEVAAAIGEPEPKTFNALSLLVRWRLASWQQDTNRYHPNVRPNTDLSTWVERNTWTERNRLSDGRVVYINEAGVELVQRPDGEWTHRPPSSPIRLELCTHNLEEAKTRTTWTPEQWQAWRTERAAQVRGKTS